MKPEYIARIDEVVQSATRALFETHGVTLSERASVFAGTPRDHDVAASIGFTAAHIRGAMLMTSRKEIVAHAWPAELRHKVPEDRDVYDWAGELVNQLLGRVKNALGPFGLALEQGTPTVITGWHLHRAPASTSVARRYLFEASGGSIAIYFDAAVGQGFVLSESRDENMQPVAEGGVELF
jgi:hypothetical protein